MLPKPWFRKDKKAWYLQVSRHQQKCLGKTRAEADIAYREWLLDQGQPLPRQDQQKLTVAEIAQEFLDDSLAKSHGKQTRRGQRSSANQDCRRYLATSRGIHCLALSIPTPRQGLFR